MRVFLSSSLVMTAVIALSHLSCGGGSQTAESATVRVATPDEMHAHIDSLAGNVVLVNIWATWCGPCVIEFPHIISVARNYADRGFRVVSISVDQPDAILKSVKPFIKDHHPPFSIMVNDWGDPMDLLNSFEADLSGAIPATMVFDRSGKLRAVREGGLSEEMLIAMFEEYL